MTAERRQPTAAASRIRSRTFSIWRREIMLQSRLKLGKLEAGCYVIQTIRKPTDVKSEYSLNGAVFDPAEFKR